jgi:type II secretory pathway pseudopilin PulG
LGLQLIQTSSYYPEGIMNEIVKAAKTSALAVWSMILGIMSFLCFGFLAGIPAVICGHMARSKIRQSQGTLTGGGMALAGLILGYIGIVITTLGILAAIAIPNFIAYRDKAYCSLVEAEANNAAAAITCYFSDPSRNKLPTLAELASDSECAYDPPETIPLMISGTAEQIAITATDNSGRCPRGSQYVLSIPRADDDGWR